MALNKLNNPRTKLSKNFPRNHVVLGLIFWNFSGDEMRFSENFAYVLHGWLLNTKPSTFLAYNCSTKWKKQICNSRDIIHNVLHKGLMKEPVRTNDPKRKLQALGPFPFWAKLKNHIENQYSTIQVLLLQQHTNFLLFLWSFLETSLYDQGIIFLEALKHCHLLLAFLWLIYTKKKKLFATKLLQNRKIKSH